MMRVNIWNEKDTKTVSRWLSQMSYITLMPFLLTILVTFYLEVSSFIIYPISIRTSLTIGYSYHGIDVNFTRIYPLFSPLKLAMLIVTGFSLVLFGVVSWYREFVDILKDIEGYKHFSDVKKAMNSLKHGLKKDKTMITIGKMSIIASVVTLVLVYLHLVEIYPSLILGFITLLFAIFAVLCWYFSHRYFKRRLVPHEGKYNS